MMMMMMMEVSLRWPSGCRVRFNVLVDWCAHLLLQLLEFVGHGLTDVLLRIG